MSLSEPPLKKFKLAYDIDSALLNIVNNYINMLKTSEKPLEIVLADDIYHPVPITNVYVGHIKEPRLISKTIMLLNERIPLQGLQHLKRVKGRYVVLCPVELFDSSLSIQQYLELNVPELNDVFEYFKEVNVPLLPPQVISQYREASKLWSVNFHPNGYLESIISNTIFEDKDLKYHRQLMLMCFETAKWYVTRYNIQTGDIFKDINVAVVVDPKAYSVVAIAIDNRLQHPMQHAAMLAIDNVAKTQNAGAWISSEEKNETDRSLSGINSELHLYLSEMFPCIRFGARPYEAKSESGSVDKSNSPYLCTGYNIYMMREPCVMCAMALTHARMNRIFFCCNNDKEGALKSRTKLHLNQALNHRYEVFTGFL